METHKAHISCDNHYYQVFTMSHVQQSVYYLISSSFQWYLLGTKMIGPVWQRLIASPLCSPNIHFLLALRIGMWLRSAHDGLHSRTKVCPLHILLIFCLLDAGDVEALCMWWSWKKSERVIGTQLEWRMEEWVELWSCRETQRALCACNILLSFAWWL